METCKRLPCFSGTPGYDALVCHEMLRKWPKFFNLNSFQIDIKETYLKLRLKEGQLGRTSAKCATSVQKLSAK